MPRFFHHPAFRGALTALLMIIALVILKEYKLQEETWSQYLIYFLYAIGIGWTLWIAQKKIGKASTFGKLFQEGFRHFAVTSLLLVGFTIFILWLNPEIAKTEAENQRQLLIETQKYTPDEIDEFTATAEKQYPVLYISATVFRYLFLGAVFAAIGSFLLPRKN